MKLFSLLLVVTEHVIAELGCQDGWDTFQGKCYYYSDIAIVKPDAKRYCWENMNESELLLISTPAENNYFAAKVAEKGVESYWLRINDKNDEDTWVVDRRGYKKPTSWSNQSYFNWNAASLNGEVENSAVVTASGLWNRNDKFATSEFVCEGNFVEIESDQSGSRNVDPNAANNGARNYPTGGNAPTSDDDVLKCWTCSEKSYAACGTSGSLQTCLDNEKSCQLEVRQRWGFVINITTGCKAPDACANNKSQNFRGSNPAHTQCRPEDGYRHSVCRHCCFKDSCVNEPTWWKPTSRAEWNANSPQ